MKCWGALVEILALNGGRDLGLSAHHRHVGKMPLPVPGDSIITSRGFDYETTHKLQWATAADTILSSMAMKYENARKPTYTYPSIAISTIYIPQHHPTKANSYLALGKGSFQKSQRSHGA
jgi:hypothetical protein